MAAQNHRQGDDEGVTGGVTLSDGGSTDDELPNEFEAALTGNERRREAVIDQYERVLETRERFRRETRSDETFVWTGVDRDQIVAFLDRLR